MRITGYLCLACFAAPARPAVGGRGSASVQFASLGLGDAGREIKFLDDPGSLAAAGGANVVVVSPQRTPRRQEMTEFGLALYNALMGIQIPHEQARDVITALERDMLTSLATKSGLAALRELLAARADALEARIVAKFDRAEVATAARVEQAQAATAARFDSLETRMAARFENFEARMTAKLGGIMAAGIELIAALFVLTKH